MSESMTKPDWSDVHLRRVREGLEHAIHVEVDRRRREGLPIIVQLDGEIVDLQEVERKQRDAQVKRDGQ